MSKFNQNTASTSELKSIEDMLAASENLAAQVAIEAANAPKIEKPAANAKAKKTAKAEAAPATIATPAVIVHVPGVIRDLVSNVTPKQTKRKETEIISEFTKRVAFEQTQPALSGKMVPNLEAAQKKMATPGTANLFVAMDIDPTFINREIAAGSKFNVYGLQKVNDLVTGIGSGVMQNAINRAVLMSMFNFRTAGLPFTGEAALAAVSDKIKVDKAIAKHLVRHSVSANTASTQKSSTMNALEVLGVVVSNQLRGNAEVFTLTDTPQTRRLQEVLFPVTLAA